jgi:parallel beta-helix repeat protein
MKTQQLFTLLVALAGLILGSVEGSASSLALSPVATTIYVDSAIGVQSCADYAPATRSCGGGSATAYSTLGEAAMAAQAGDTVLIRQGSYSEQLQPHNSGAPGSPVTYRSYPGEAVVLTGGFSPAVILLEDVAYITIEGLRVEDSRWLEAVNAQNIVIRNNTFLRTPASGTTGNVRFVSSDYNRIVGNTLDDGNDNLLLIDSDYNLVEGNTLAEGRHSLLSVRCSNYNIIRNNHFANTQQKIAEVYDCGEDTSAVPHAFDATHHNVIEGNVFAEASSYYSTSGGNGIQYSGQEGIIRRNIFYHTNVGLGMQVYGDEALYNHNNRVAHNVFYDNECAGIAVRGDGLDNVYKNNILYKNKGISGDCSGTGPGQVVYREPLAEFFFVRNNLLSEHPGEAVIQEEFGSGETLAYFEANYPELFAGNRELAPGFKDEAAYDFTLFNTSPMVDAGAFLAHASSAGSGAVLPVDDALYFHDGFGIPGASGDLIQLEGQTQAARVIDVDYDARTLVLDRPLTWQAGQGVSLAYTGIAPDIGYYELATELELDLLLFLPLVVQPLVIQGQ